MPRLVLLVAACAFAGACEMLDSPTAPAPPPPAGAVNYTAVGASDAIGFGGSIPCVPFTPCPGGTGYVQTLGRRLESDGRTVTLTNLGIPGAVLSPEIQGIGNAIGRDIFANLLERGMPFVPRNSTLVTVFAGGNDANTVGAALEAGLAGADWAGYVSTRILNYGRDLKALVAGVRDRAPSVRVVVLNLPNMAGLPYAAGYPIDKKRWLQQVSVGFSAQANALAAQGALVIDLMCHAAIYQPGMYSPDGFHPNDAGYALLTELIFPVATTGAATPPRASCPQMTLF